MSDFVNHENTAHRPDKGAYGTVINKIKEDGVCPFCPGNLAKYHKHPILKEGSHWLLTNNMYPYEGTKYHILLIHKTHITDFTELSSDAWEDLRGLIDWFLKENNIPGGALIMRFGDTRYTGASVSHLHANLVSADFGGKDHKPVLARVA